ncbi:ImmA/IrrE family metallo-endopeptidase [Floccifex sp.]|uniref:ImmA/IrrE family metallo-endopeptidase n=1 Tax=Floccifex sp. TaxID=2815810 RepID=UPI0029FF4BAD|nr:ImmA/IrrE family metallo-endopeptidase [Floccifex sp.]MDD7280792.1 ImmA/IrrE family metallo-endopeptidase [Erysipelotrichaceae bacterium]MDY2957665.1 ImmA/IrrE family metallo-endopeptidase [Floccifex sp.]
MKTAQELNSLALRTRRIWNEDAYSPIDIFAIVNGWKDKKITIVKYPLSPRISGMCTKENEDIVICINSTTSYGRQRFTLAHELYHVLYEENMQRVICDMNMNGDKSESEKEANQFASYLLMPYDALLEYELDKGKWDIEKVIDAEQFFQVSHQAMIHRLVSDGLISSDIANDYKAITVSTLAAKLGYGKELYFPTEKNRQYFTTGEYIRKVEKMAEKELISEGKREELLMDAYRADIVYDFDEEENLND